MAEKQAESKAIVDQASDERARELQEIDQVSVEGEFKIDSSVIASVAGVAAREVDGVADLGTFSIRKAFAERVGGSDTRSRGVEVEAGSKEAIVDLAIKVHYGYSIPRIVQEVRRNVATRLLEMCGLVAKEININIVSMEFGEQQQARRVE